MSAPARLPSGFRQDDMRAVFALHNAAMASILSTSKGDAEIALRRARLLAHMIVTMTEATFCDTDPHLDAAAEMDREMARFLAGRKKRDA